MAEATYIHITLSRSPSPKQAHYFTDGCRFPRDYRVPYNTGKRRNKPTLFVSCWIISLLLQAKHLKQQLPSALPFSRGFVRASLISQHAVAGLTRPGPYRPCPDRVFTTSHSTIILTSYYWRQNEFHSRWRGGLEEDTFDLLCCTYSTCDTRGSGIM